MAQLLPKFAIVLYICMQFALGFCNTATMTANLHNDLCLQQACEFFEMLCLSSFCIICGADNAPQVCCPGAQRPDANDQLPSWYPESRWVPYESL